jgi:hypothetical protein
MPEKHDHELEAVTALIPLLGPMVGEPVRVDGRNNEHPGQTFDFALSAETRDSPATSSRSKTFVCKARRLRRRDTLTSQRDRLVGRRSSGAGVSPASCWAIESAMSFGVLRQHSAFAEWLICGPASVECHVGGDHASRAIYASKRLDGRNRRA